jgi:hypothetical protein
LPADEPAVPKPQAKAGRFRYRADVLEALGGHGVAPTGSTRPELVREFVSDLYRFEIRQLRARYLAGEFPKQDYSARVEALRNRYPVLALRPAEFLERR